MSVLVLAYDPASVNNDGDETVSIFYCRILQFNVFALVSVGHKDSANFPEIPNKKRIDQHTNGDNRRVALRV